MSTIIQALEAEQLAGKAVPNFNTGDTVIVRVKVKEGNRERLQAFEGVVIAIKNRGLNSAFTVRKISHHVGVERVFQTYSPQIESITVKRRGDVRQATLYHLRGLTGKKARIKEKLSDKLGADVIVHAAPETVVEETADNSVDAVAQPADAHADEAPTAKADTQADAGADDTAADSKAE